MNLATTTAQHARTIARRDDARPIRNRPVPRDRPDSFVRHDVSGSCRVGVCGLRRIRPRAHPERGFTSVPSPVHDLGADAVVLGSGLWTTVGNLWINLAQARVVHPHPELSQGCTQAPSPGLDTSRRAVVRVIHTIHSTYYYYCFYLQGLSTKKKQGVRACERTRREVEAKAGRGRLDPWGGTLYGDEQRLVFPRGGVLKRLRDSAAPRAWKGLS
jgi:hypothetical protein